MLRIFRFSCNEDHVTEWNVNGHPHTGTTQAKPDDTDLFLALWKYVSFSRDRLEYKWGFKIYPIFRMQYKVSKVMINSMARSLFGLWRSKKLFWSPQTRRILKIYGCKMQNKNARTNVNFRKMSKQRFIWRSQKIIYKSLFQFQIELTLWSQKSYFE